ncbi:unnamed protein product [Amoebophrya sp. A25]|nr:unnamed protein product [Amoebophrya sp. A25]|eukprot:GSA25T00021423001.1
MRTCTMLFSSSIFFTFLVTQTQLLDVAGFLRAASSPSFDPPASSSNMVFALGVAEKKALSSTSSLSPAPMTSSEQGTRSGPSNALSASSSAAVVGHSTLSSSSSSATGIAEQGTGKSKKKSHDSISSRIVKKCQQQHLAQQKQAGQMPFTSTLLLSTRESNSTRVGEDVGTNNMPMTGATTCDDGMAGSSEETNNCGTSSLERVQHDDPSSRDEQLQHGPYSCSTSPDGKAAGASPFKTFVDGANRLNSPAPVYRSPPSPLLAFIPQPGSLASLLANADELPCYLSTSASSLAAQQHDHGASSSLLPACGPWGVTPSVPPPASARLPTPPTTTAGSTKGQRPRVRASRVLGPRYVRVTWAGNSTPPPDLKFPSRGAIHLSRRIVICGPPTPNGSGNLNLSTSSSEIISPTSGGTTTSGGSSRTTAAVHSSTPASGTRSKGGQSRSCGGRLSTSGLLSGSGSRFGNKVDDSVAERVVRNLWLQRGFQRAREQAGNTPTTAGEHQSGNAYSGERRRTSEW